MREKERGRKDKTDWQIYENYETVLDGPKRQPRWPEQLAERAWILPNNTRIVPSAFSLSCQDWLPSKFKR